QLELERSRRGERDPQPGALRLRPHPGAVSAVDTVHLALRSEVVVDLERVLAAPRELVAHQPVVGPRKQDATAMDDAVGTAGIAVVLAGQAVDRAAIEIGEEPGAGHPPPAEGVAGDRLVAPVDHHGVVGATSRSPAT